jgi:outer membrane immunogenic protein
MKQITAILLATAAGAGMMSTAYAADLIITQPMTPAGYVDVGGNWEGAYIGIHGGYAAGEFDHIVAGFPNNDGDMDGFLLGVQAGFNFYLSDAVVGGIEADISWANIEGTCVNGPGVCAFPTTQTIDWEGSLRGRLGFDGGAFMPYVTAGLAVAHGTRSSLGGSAKATHIGWTAGAGVEFAATDDLSLNLMYRYSDYGSSVYEYGSDPEVALTTHAVTVGLNWRF